MDRRRIDQRVDRPVDQVVVLGLLVNWRVPLSVVRARGLSIAVALTTFIELLGASAIRPCAGPLPLL